ncbi:MAG: c-type cytochrome [Acidobacteriia bacterium]|nr:c-type cytochrome [Terriglobia bacterium]
MPVIAADPFTRRCSGCHALDVDKEGPRLRGVVGRKAGSVADFGYSQVLRESGIVWDEATLDKWLEDPQKLVPGNAMEFRVPNVDERAAIIAYLKSLSK